jgi:RNA polymerase sigma-70 factor (ECF subfamily)
MTAALEIALLAPAEPKAASDAARARRIEVIFDAHYDAVWRTLRGLGIPDASADDAAQRVFLTAARRIDEIIEGREGAYLYGIALRVASELRRRASSRREIADDDTIDALVDEAPGPEDRLLEGEALEALDDVLDGMPDDLREVLVLVEMEGLSIPQLAEVLGVVIGTAASRVRRAREAFTKSARRVRARLESGVTP